MFFYLYFLSNLNPDRSAFTGCLLVSLRPLMLASDCFESNFVPCVSVGQPTRVTAETAKLTAQCWFIVKEDSSSEDRMREIKDKPTVPVLYYLNLMLFTLTLQICL